MVRGGTRAGEGREWRRGAVRGSLHSFRDSVGGATGKAASAAQRPQGISFVGRICAP